MMRAIRQGLLAGLLAGFLAALLLLVDYGPGNSLHGAARWFALDSQGAGKFVGFLLMLILGGLFGMLFGAVIQRWQVTLGRALGVGLLIGAIWWLVIVFLLGTVVNHLSLNFASWLISFTPLLVYGMLLGSIFFSRRAQSA